jgi:hypothetical protein
VCSIQNLIGVVYVLAPLVSIVSRWPGFELQIVSGVDSARRQRQQFELMAVGGRQLR